jgi:hypothetical protein
MKTQLPASRKIFSDAFPVGECPASAGAWPVRGRLAARRAGTPDPPADGRPAHRHDVNGRPGRPVFPGARGSIPCAPAVLPVDSNLSSRARPPRTAHRYVNVAWDRKKARLSQAESERAIHEMSDVSLIATFHDRGDLEGYARRRMALWPPPQKRTGTVACRTHRTGGASHSAKGPLAPRAAAPSRQRGRAAPWSSLLTPGGEKHEYRFVASRAK